MADTTAPQMLAVRRRKEGRREEWVLQTRLAQLLAEYLDPRTTFWSGVENAPRSAKSGLFQKRRGIAPGLPDVMVLHDGRLLGLELKSKRGVASPAQREVAEAIARAGGRWWLCRSPRSALMALRLSGVVFRRRWRRPPQLRDWEGPFDDPTQRLPQHPRVAAERRAAQQRWRARQRAREAARRAGQPAPTIPAPQPDPVDVRA